MAIISLPADRVQRSRYIVGYISAIGTTAVFILTALTGAGWRVPTLLAVANYALIGQHIIRYRDTLFLKLMTTACLAAPFALLGDWWSVRDGGLRYVQEGPFVLVSPLYLPLLYPVGTVQIWFTADNVRFLLQGDNNQPMKPLTMVVAMAVSGLFGALYVPFYEFLAKGGHLWVYKGYPGPFPWLLHNVVPYYVIMAEIIQFSLTPFMISDVARWDALKTVLNGAVMGVFTVGAWAVSLKWWNKIPPFSP